MPCLIKVCGLSRSQDIEAVNRAKPDFAGFIVNFPKSHRSIDPHRLATLSSGLDEGIKAVGVFVDQPPRLIADLVRSGAIDMVQLHGSEDDGYIARLRAMCDVPVIKAFKVRGSQDVREAEASSADFILLDNGCGTGARFDWNAVGEVSRPFILAGGLTPQDIPEALDRLHPWAVDLSSGLETGKKKDPAKIARAVEAVRSFG